MLPTVFVFYWMITLARRRSRPWPTRRLSCASASRGRLPRGFTKYPFFLYVEQPGGGGGLHGARSSRGLPAAYSIARWRQQRLAVVILVARIIPGIAYLIPWYIFFRSSGW
jgi:hypothetical protein